MTEALCNAVVARLRAKMPGFEAEYFPDAPARYPWAKKDKSLLVGYEGSTFGEMQSLAPQSADESVDISVTVLVRSLRGAFGVSDTLGNVRQALFGWRAVHSVTSDVDGSPVTLIVPLGFRPFVPVRIAFVSEDQGAWRYVIVFRAATVVVADVSDPDNIGPPFTGATFKDPE